MIFLKTATRQTQSTLSWTLWTLQSLTSLSTLISCTASPHTLVVILSAPVAAMPSRTHGHHLALLFFQ
ncbi:hypothetical protein AQUCO_02000231v1 [Aquilegia coerulea]|uniref:Uncharacterized protein n=1 Tax=Aquilegia coerulea TaxID=218851 RepID=A0A2G5DGI5_AQUCA|nr:hypothetical protein AQUCO_02000231v1 [Aquilegia coerulea]